MGSVADDGAGKGWQYLDRFRNSIPSDATPGTNYECRWRFSEQLNPGCTTSRAIGTTRDLLLLNCMNACWTCSRMTGVRPLLDTTTPLSSARAEKRLRPQSLPARSDVRRRMPFLEVAGTFGLRLLGFSWPTSRGSLRAVLGEAGSANLGISVRCHSRSFPFLANYPPRANTLDEGGLCSRRRNYREGGFRNEDATLAPRTVCTRCRCPWCGAAEDCVVTISAYA